LPKSRPLAGRPVLRLGGKYIYIYIYIYNLFFKNKF
jgi:hypothetical protein